jgi:hypothetical protein
VSVALPLALTARYEPPDGPGDYAFVVVDLNGQELLRMICDDPVADTHHRTGSAIRETITDLLSDLFRGAPRVHVPR